MGWVAKGGGGGGIFDKRNVVLELESLKAWEGCQEGRNV